MKEGMCPIEPIGKAIVEYIRIAGEICKKKTIGELPPSVFLDVAH